MSCYFDRSIFVFLGKLDKIRPSQDSSVWLWLTSREQLMSTEYSKHQVVSFTKILVVWWTNRKYSVLISVLQSAQWINSERIYPQTRVSSFPGLYICLSIKLCVCVCVCVCLCVCLQLPGYVSKNYTKNQRGGCS